MTQTINKSELLNYTIYSLMGVELLTGMSAEDEINMKSLKAGVYVMKIRQNDTTITKRFIKYQE